MKVKVTDLPGYDDFIGSLVRKFKGPNGMIVCLVSFEWEGDDEYVIALEKHVTQVTEY